MIFFQIQTVLQPVLVCAACFARPMRGTLQVNFEITRLVAKEVLGCNRAFARGVFK